MKISDQRRTYQRSGKQLRRARCLFIYLQRHKILFGSNAYMNSVVKAMRRAGLYADATDDRSVRFWILRRLFKVHNPDGHDWYRWYAAYHWTGWEWRRKA